jgi:hypothetical protein
VEDSLKGLIERLGNAINQSVSESKEVAATLEEIKQAGHKISLTIEATIRCQDEGNGEAVSTSPLELPSEE